MCYDLGVAFAVRAYIYLNGIGLWDVICPGLLCPLESMGSLGIDGAFCEVDSHKAYAVLLHACSE